MTATQNSSDPQAEPTRGAGMTAAFAFSTPTEPENNDARIKRVLSEAFAEIIVLGDQASTGRNVYDDLNEVRAALLVEIAAYAAAYAAACVAAIPQGAAEQRAAIFEGLSVYFAQSGGSQTWKDMQLSGLFQNEADSIRLGEAGKIDPKNVQAEQDLAKVRATLAAAKVRRS